MRTNHFLPNTFLTQTSPLHPAPTTLSATTTLAHIYATIHASSNSSSSGSSGGSSSSSMWRPEARPPLAHARSITHGEGGLPAELHAQYSMIAVIVLTALFFTITISATGLLLAFCKKNNSVFSLQKSEQDSHYEMEDLEKTDTESCCHDDDIPAEAASSGSREQRRSQTFPDLTSSDPHQLVSIESSFLAKSSHTLDVRTPLMRGTNTRAAQRTDVNRRGEGAPKKHSSFKRSVTVAAIHHSDHQPADSASSCSVTIHVEDFDSRSDISDSAFGHLYLQLQEEEEETEAKDDDSDMDDVHNDQTRALLKC